MIYSRWRSDRGGYDYYETPDRLGLGDDLAVPILTGGTELGVPSTEAGRSIPAGARHVGSGEFARGMIAPMARSAYGRLGALTTISTNAIVWLLGGLGIGWYLWGRKRS